VRAHQHCNVCKEHATDFEHTTGEGIVYSYDAVGCFEKMKYTVSGTGQALIEPFLDNMVAYKNTDKKPLGERCVMLLLLLLLLPVIALQL